MTQLTALPPIANFREVVVDLPAMTHNVSVMRERVAGSALLVVVKANGYGHGMIDCARAALAGGADWLGVADLTEALALRDAGITAPVLAWLHAPNETFTTAIVRDIALGVSTREQLERIAEIGSGRVHLKLDTGLSRNGFAPADWADVFARAAELERVGALVVEGIFSHVSNTHEDEDAAAATEFDRALEMARAAGLAPDFIHLSASLTALTMPALNYSMVRIGLAAYGLSPIDGRDPSEFGLRPVMTVRSQVAAVRRVPAGVGVSYDYTYRPAAETTLALVPVGYGEGVPRAGSNRAPIQVAGITSTVAGRVAMDQIVVDMADVAVAVGDEVVLFGDPARGVPSAAQWAAACETNVYEIVTRMGGRLTRVVVE